MKIKAIVFDIGDVVLLEHEPEVYLELANKLGLEVERIKQVRKKYVGKALTRKRRGFWYEKKIAKDLKVHSKNFIKYWQAFRDEHFEFNPGIKEILESLKKQGYLLVTLTNVVFSHDLLRKKMNVYGSFDFVFKSRKLGIKKPDEKIFKMMLKKLGLLPQQVLFIDDFEMNVKAAKKLGINAIKFKNINQLKKEFKKFYVDLE